MVTAKPKRMMFGGVARGAMNSVKKAVAAKAAPMKMQNAARSAAQQAAFKPIPPQARSAPGLAMAKAQKDGMMKKGGAVKKATKK